MQTLCNMLKRECLAKDIYIEDQFIPFYLYSIPFCADAYLSEKPEEIFANIKRFVQELGQALAMNQTVSLNTLKLQYFYMKSCFDIKLIQSRNQTAIRKRSQITLKKVLGAKLKSSIESRERLLAKITSLVVIDNGIADVTDSQNVKETENAVKSVLSLGDLDLFVKLKRREKLDVLEDLKVIVCGIRLFNNDAGHENSVRIIDRKRQFFHSLRTLIFPILSVTAVIEKSFDNTRLILEYEADQTKSLAKRITEKIRSNGNLEYSSENDEDLWNYLKDFSVFIHQKRSFLATILSSLMNQKMDIIDTINGYLKTMKEIHAMLIYKTAINSKDIFVRESYN